MSSERRRLPAFRSVIANVMGDFVKGKLLCGLNYRSEIQELSQFDRFIAEEGLTTCMLPRDLVDRWTSKRPHESCRTHAKRFRIIRQFARFMGVRGHEVYVPDRCLEPLAKWHFAPYIFSHAEIFRFMARIDDLHPCHRSMVRHIVLPEVFRVLYGCGLRVSEATRLKLEDVDLDQGILTIRHGKCGKDRLVPMAPELTARLKHLCEQLAHRVSSVYLFPLHTGKPYCSYAIYRVFRCVLQEIGIPHRGRGQGP